MIETPQLKLETTAEPVIVAVQPPAAVATTVYVPTADCVPKLKAAPVPATGAPTFAALNCN